MKKSTKIGVSILIVILIGSIISASLNVWVKHLVCQQLDTNIASADSIRIQYSNVRLTVLTGKAWIKDVYFCTNSTQSRDTTQGYMEGHLDMLSLDGINYYNWLVKRQLNLRGLTITKPNFCIYFLHNVERKEGNLLQEQMEQERRERLENVLRIARIFIDDATLERLTIDQGAVSAHSINDSLRITIPEFTLNLYDLGYNIKDSVPHYNDSVFHFSIGDVDVHIPDVKMDIHVKGLMAEPNGVMQLNDVQIQSYLNEQKTESVIAGVKQMSWGGFDVAKFNFTKEIDIKNIHLYEPYFKLEIDESTQAVKSRENKTRMELDALDKKIEQFNMTAVTEFITGMVIDTIFLHDARIDVQSVSTHFELQANQIFMALYGVGFSLINEIPYHYNDSVYQFYVGYANILTPDSIIAITAHDLRYDNGGAFSLGNTHIRHVIDRWQLTHLIGDEPATLVDMQLNSLRTSSKNIIKEVYTLDNGFLLDTLYADIRSMSIFRDARNTVKEPYVLPQAYLTQLSYPFVVHCVQAKVNTIHIQMALTEDNIGKFDLGPIRLNISNVTPIHNSIITTTATGKMGKANIQARFNMTVNQACNWHLNLDAKNINAHHLDSLLYPLVGITIGCDIHHLRADYSGNHSLASGTFCMEYDNVSIFADKNSSSPIKAVKNLSGLINSAGRTLIHPANPICSDLEPVSYQVRWKNDPWVDPALFYIGPVIDGCVETMLPGLFLHRRIKQNKK